MSAANRKRGHDAERKVVRYLRDNGYPDAITTRAKLGHDGATAPGDLDWHPLVCLEVKDVARSAWPSWCRQAAAEARPGMVPAVVRRTRGVTDVGLWPVRIKVTATLPLGLFPPSPKPVRMVDDAVWTEVFFADLLHAVKAADGIEAVGS